MGATRRCRRTPSEISGFRCGVLTPLSDPGVERDPDGSVWYVLSRFSRPRHPLARLMRPYARRLQRRFARMSGAAMQAAVRA